MTSAEQSSGDYLQKSTAHKIKSPFRRARLRLGIIVGLSSTGALLLATYNNKWSSHNNTLDVNAAIARTTDPGQKIILNQERDIFVAQERQEDSSLDKEEALEGILVVVGLAEWILYSRRLDQVDILVQPSQAD